MNPDTEKQNAQYQTLLVLWCALLVSQFLFVVLLFFVKPNLFHFDAAKPLLGSNPPLVIGLAVVGIGSLFFSFVFEKKFLNQSVEQQNVGLVQQALIMACALCEVVSLFGLLLAFVMDYSYFWIFFLFGILGIILHFPRRSNLEAASFKKLS